MAVEIQKQKVVINGHGTTSRLGIVRAVAELGCEITVVVMAWPKAGKSDLDRVVPYDCQSKYISRVLFCHFKDGEGLIRLLLEDCTDPDQKVILLPDSDFSAMVIDRNWDRLSPHFLFPHVGDQPGGVYGWMDKLRQKELARQVGLNVPDAVVVSIDGGKYVFPEGVHYPCFTKALVTIVGGKQLFHRCDTPEALRKVLDEIGRQQDADVLVEDFKEIETEYAVLGFSDGEEVIIPGVIRFISNSSSHFGIALKGEIMPVKGFEAILDQFATFVRRVGFIGVFDIDFYESAGVLYFGEMNLRFGGSGYAVTRMGVNLPAMLVRHLRGESIADLPKFVQGTSTFVNERMCNDDWYQQRISTKEFNDLLASADIRFLEDAEDPDPQRRFFLLHRKQARKRFIKTLLHR